MALSQVIWSLDQQQLLPVGSLRSEQELEEALHKSIDLLNPNWLLIGRQVKTPNGKCLDLLCIDRDGALVIVELKKDLTPREVTAQVIEYASYIAEKKPEELAQIHLEFREKYYNDQKPLNEAFRGKFGADLDENQVNQSVKMVIVATKMDDGTEHIIRFLRETYHVDINILFFQVFQGTNERFLSRAWLEEDLELSDEPRPTSDWNGEYYVSFGTGERKWSDAKKYGFISAGGGNWYTRTLSLLHPGDRVWVNIPQTGYVGVGIVAGEMSKAKDAVLTMDGVKRPMATLELSGNYFYSDDDNYSEYVVPVQWLKTVPEESAIKETGFFGNQNTVCRPTSAKWQFTVDRLKSLWNIKETPTTYSEQG